MSKDIPEIDDLTRGINDSELILTQDSVETQVEHKEKNNQAQEKNTAVSLSDTGCWDEFMEFLQSDGSGTDKTERLVCKLDRDLADSLDDCDIHGRCRSDRECHRKGILQVIPATSGRIQKGKEIVV